MLGPGDYVPDATEGITRVEDLPTPRVEQRSRNWRARACPKCGHRARRYGMGVRTLHDLGDVRTDQPVDLLVRFSRHRCPHCGCCFCADLSDLARSGTRFGTVYADPPWAYDNTATRGAAAAADSSLAGTALILAGLVLHEGSMPRRQAI